MASGRQRGQLDVEQVVRAENAVADIHTVGVVVEPQGTVGHIGPVFRIHPGPPADAEFLGGVAIGGDDPCLDPDLAHRHVEMLDHSAERRQVLGGVVHDERVGARIHAHGAARRECGRRTIVPAEGCQRCGIGVAHGNEGRLQRGKFVEFTPTLDARFPRRSRCRQPVPRKPRCPCAACSSPRSPGSDRAPRPMARRPDAW